MDYKALNRKYKTTYNFPNVYSLSSSIPHYWKQTLKGKIINQNVNMYKCQVMPWDYQVHLFSHF